MKKIIYIVLIILIFVSCENNHEKRELKKIYGEKIEFPQDMLYVENGEIKNNTFVINNDYILLSYIDSSFCNKCHVRTFGFWKEIIDTCSLLGCNAVFIFSPKLDELEDVLSFLKSSFPYPVYVDANHEFKSTNNFIPNEIEYNTFLLDNNGCIKIVGNPLYSESIWTLYKTVLYERKQYPLSSTQGHL